MSDEESNSDIDPLVESLAGVSVKKLSKLGAHLSSRYPQPPLVPPPTVPKPLPVPPPTFAVNYDLYCKDYNEQINIDGIAKTARFLGLKDVTKLTAALDRYTISQREILKGINEKFEALGVTGGKKQAKEHDVADNKSVRDLNQIMRSEQNSRYVDLLAKRPVEVVAKGYGETNEDLKVAVEEFEELISALEDKVRVEKDKAKKSEASSSQPNKKGSSEEGKN